MSVSITSMCTTKRRIPASASTKWGSKKGELIPLCGWGAAERGRHRQRERERKREREREKERERPRHREKERETEKQRERDIEIDRVRGSRG